jgi:hypothetical protein
MAAQRDRGRALGVKTRTDGLHLQRRRAQTRNEHPEKAS